MSKNPRNLPPAVYAARQELVAISTWHTFPTHIRGMDVSLVVADDLPYGDDFVSMHHTDADAQDKIAEHEHHVLNIWRGWVSRGETQEGFIDWRREVRRARKFEWEEAVQREHERQHEEAAAAELEPDVAEALNALAETSAVTTLDIPDLPEIAADAHLDDVGD